LSVEEKQLDSPGLASERGGHAAQRRRRVFRRQLNVPLLVFSLVAVAIVLVACKALYNHKKLQLADVFLQRAEKLESQEKLPQAITYLQRYLWIKPNDLERRLQLIDVYEKGVKTPRERGRINSMLYEMLGLAPERNDLRLRLAENLLTLKDYSRAEKEARVAEKSSKEGSPEQAKAKRLIALSLYPRARKITGSEKENTASRKAGSEDKSWAQRSEGVSIESAARALADSWEDFPGDVDLASVTAEFHRQYQSLLQSESFDAVKYANSVMERLLKEKSKDPDAFVRVYLYRTRHNLPDAKSFLAESLRLDPNHHRALLLSAAISALDAKSPQDALSATSDKLQKAIEAQPKDQQAYLVLARLRARAGDIEGSIKALREGKQNIEVDSPVLGQELVAMLLQAKMLPEAEEALDELGKYLQSVLLQLPAASRREKENLLRVLHGKLSIQKGDLSRAFAELKVVADSTEQVSSTTSASSGIEARRLLGLLCEEFRYWDLAASYWSSLTVSVPHFGEAHRRAGLNHLRINQPDKAVFHLQHYLKPANPNAWSPQKETWIALLQAHLQLQLRRSAQSQNWAEFIETLNQVKKRLPGRWEIPFAEADYLNAQTTPESREKAFQLLLSAEKQHDREPEFWRNLVRVYSSLQRPVDAERALNKYDELESDTLKRTLMRAALLAREKKYDAAEAMMVSLLPTVNSTARLGIQMQRLKIMQAAKQADQAKHLLNELIAAEPKNSQLLSVGIEMMLNAGDHQTAQVWEEQLKGLGLQDDYLWQFYRARRLLVQYESLSESQRIELEQLITSLRSSRPGLYNVVGLVAHHAELLGNTREAIDNYELAIKLGDNNSELLKRLVLLLNNEGRFTDADVYLSRLSASLGGTLQVESLEISSALRDDKIQEAVELAREAVDRHPDDPQRIFWLASLLSLDKQYEAAEVIYQDALVKFPKDSRLWNGLFTLLVKDQQLDQASSVLETLVQTLESDPAKRHFALAHGYTQLGNRERALSECQLAIQADPSHVACRLLYANLLLATDTPSAEKQLLEILKLDANDKRAKLQLASIWTASGRPADTQRAMKLLESMESVSVLEHQANNRLRAQLLSQQGRSQQERQENITAARRIIEEQLERSNPPVDVDRILLAKIYEAEGMFRGDIAALQASREQWQLLFDRPQVVLSYHLQYLDFLFRQLSTPAEESEQLVDWEKLRESFLIEVEGRVSELEELQREDPESLSTLQLLDYQVRLKKVQGELGAAVQIIDEFTEHSLSEAEATIGKARSYLVIGNLYASIENHLKAAEWYRKLSEIAPQTYALLVRELATLGQLNEAIDVCLASQNKIEGSAANVATVLAQLISNSDQETEAEQRIQPIIDAALESHKDDVDLLLAVGVLKVTKGEVDMAIRHFEHVLGVDPEHPLALNNLATLLSESSDRLPEALKYIEQAIQTSGRQPALLDTLGTIQIRMGEFQLAIASLEECVAIGRGDARYYFHLAVAYQAAGQTEESRNSLQRARRSGLAKMILTQGDQELLKNLEQQIGFNNS